MTKFRKSGRGVDLRRAARFAMRAFFAVGACLAIAVGAPALHADDQPPTEPATEPAAGPAAEETAPAATWFDTEPEDASFIRAIYQVRAKEILDDLNATRAAFGGLPAVEWDVAESEGYYRHARYLLHHMKDPLNSGGLEQFTRQDPDMELYSASGNRAARLSHVAIKYLKKGEPVDPCSNWLPTVFKRLRIAVRSAKKVAIGYAEGTVPDGRFKGKPWAVVVVGLDIEHMHRPATRDPVNAEPVVIPVDGAQNVPVALGPDSPNPVPADMRTDSKGETRELGFPITFSFFDGRRVRPGATVDMVALVETKQKKGDADEDDEPVRKRPGKKKKRKKKKKKKPKKTKDDPDDYEIVVTEEPVDVWFSTPADRPLLEQPKWNLNSVVVIPTEPLTPGRKYRVTLKGKVLDGRNTQDVEITTTFTAAEPEED